MTTVHLIYPTLKRILDSQTNISYENKHTIRLIKRFNKIKQVLSECCALPSVIDDIIYEYSYYEIIEYVVESFVCNHFSSYFHINIRLRCHSNIIIYYAFVIPIDSSNIVTMDNNCSMMYFDNFNIFMERIYGKSQYINCKTEDNEKVTCVMKNNNIAFIHSSNISYEYHKVHIKNYRKFTHFIVELKCIINGIQRYFKTTDIEQYY